MKKSWFILLFSTLSSFIFHGVYAQTPQEFYDAFQASKAQHTAILNSSTDKDIVVFLGKTGAGKSTAINFLNDIPMRINQDDEFAITPSENHQNPFLIGNGGASTTLIPQLIYNPVVNATMYDLSGWDDNRDALESLLGAAFIKNIVEKAKSCKFVFVVEEPSIVAEHGVLFNQSIDITKKVFNPSLLPDMSALIISKSRKSVFADEMEFIKGKLSPQPLLINEKFFDIWHLTNIAPFSNGQVIGIGDNWSRQKEFILNIITRLTPKQIQSVDVGHIYSDGAKQQLKTLFDLEFNRILEQERQLLTVNSIQNLELNASNIENSADYLSTRFQARINDAIRDSVFFDLFKPLAEALYQTSYDEFALKVTNIIAQENIILTAKRTELALQEEARQQAEEQARLHAIETARIENERIQAEERARQQEISRQQADEAKRLAEEKENQYRTEIAILVNKQRQESIQVHQEVTNANNAHSGWTRKMRKGHVNEVATHGQQRINAMNAKHQKEINNLNQKFNH